MFKSHLEKISRTSSRLNNRKKSLRLDKNERIIPFSKKTIIDIKKLVTNNILQIYELIYPHQYFHYNHSTSKYTYSLKNIYIS